MIKHKLKGIICYFRRYHKYSYYTDKCVTCGKKKEKQNQGDGSHASFN
ncbi:hypothetical protein [Bacillus sp. OTU2372]